MDQADQASHKKNLVFLDALDCYLGAISSTEQSKRPNQMDRLAQIMNHSIDCDLHAELQYRESKDSELDTAHRAIRQVNGAQGCHLRQLTVLRWSQNQASATTFSQSTIPPCK